MWFLLLIALDSGEYRAEVVVKDRATCEQSKISERDLCVPVTVEFLHTDTTAWLSDRKTVH